MAKVMMITLSLKIRIGSRSLRITPRAFGSYHPFYCGGILSQLIEESSSEPENLLLTWYFIIIEHSIHQIYTIKAPSVY